MIHKNGILNKSIYGTIVAILATMSNATAANVVQRPTANRTTAAASRITQAASRMPTMAVKTTSVSTSASATPVNTVTETAPTVTAAEPATPVVVEPNVSNKSNQFRSGLSQKSNSEMDTSIASLAELIRAQRAALDAADAADAALNPAAAMGTGENPCDASLRECMIQRCGSNFGKCVADTDTTFFDKMDTCRRTANCTGREYQLFSAEIKADRDVFAKLAAYNATIDCGNSYDTCIVGQCGATYSKCIGKSAGDNAIAKCESIAKSCIEYDSGMALRTMAIFGELRQTAERQIATDEQKLYALRDQMRSVCTRLGAMFDERSLDCVYTVNYYAGNDSTLYGSKKLYAGSTFDCTQNWFGFDMTTFRENAFRETRAQTAASSAMLGAGVGIAAGAITSGAINNAIDAKVAQTDRDRAACENEVGKKWNSFLGKCVRDKTTEQSDNQSQSGAGDNSAQNGGDQGGNDNKGGDSEG